MTVLNETYTLSNGVTIPKLGLGTWMIGNDAVVQAVKDAVALGPRRYQRIQIRVDTFSGARATLRLRDWGRIA